MGTHLNLKSEADTHLAKQGTRVEVVPSVNWSSGLEAKISDRVSRARFTVAQFRTSPARGLESDR